MLNVTCPNCKTGIKISKPKAGKFSPTCKSCSTRFQLQIKRMPDETFKCQTATIPATKSEAGVADTVFGTETKADLNASDKHSAVERPIQTSPALESTTPPTKDSSALESTTPPPKVSAALETTTPPPKAGQTAGTGETAIDSHTKNDGAGRQRGSRQTSTATGKLGPYRLIKLLGEGGMGSVYLANQTSLDRNVALKVVKSNLSKHKSMLARFTREAYAAAQLVHPNVVQIYDMGDDRGNCYFSMELVDGVSLQDVVQKSKRLDPDQAASYILHASRGLQCAHNAGMVHRDIKPANLLVNHDGLVKVADLGLVKVPHQDEIESDVDQAAALSASQDLTQVGSTIGTPYYMAPEQAKSSITVDHRADIYSLGCTFYVLLTGRRPFDGNSVEEVVSKHTSAPLVVPSKIVERVPESLSNVVAKMMAKKPDDRYQNMAELIADLENYLGISSTAAFTPEESDADGIEQCAKQFNDAPLAKFRGLIPLATVAGSLLLAFVMMFVGWRWATGFVLFPLAAIVSNFIIVGVREAPILFSKVRELVIRSGILSWLKWIAAGLLLVIASFMIGAFFHWFLLSAMGVGAGAAFYFLIDRPIAKGRQPALNNAELLLRKMRLKGMDESTVLMFVAKYSGQHWEEFFEALFGYDAKRRVRDEVTKSEMGKQKPKFRAWRDGIADNLQSRIDVLNNAENQKHLEKVEQAGLVEQGVSATDAKEQAAQMAHALVDHGDSIRVAALQKRLLELDPEAQRLQRRLKIKAMLADARSGKYRKPPTMLQRIAPILDRALGSYPRFLLGCCLIVGCLMWANQNGLFEELKESALKATAAMNADGTEPDAVPGEPTSQATQTTSGAETKPLSIPLLGGVFYNFNSLVAGLLLVCSAIVLGWRMSIFVLPAAFITLWGSSLGIPESIPVKHLDASGALVGIGLFVVGMLFGRSGK